MEIIKNYISDIISKSNISAVTVPHHSLTLLGD
jgi:hypothetical protein